MTTRCLERIDVASGWWAIPRRRSRRLPNGSASTLDATSAAFLRQTLPAIKDDRMRATFRMVHGGRTLMALPRAAFLRSTMLNHWYHHRGQLGVYLRLLGATVPSSYGPSGDEMPSFMSK